MHDDDVPAAAADDDDDDNEAADVATGARAAGRQQPEQSQFEAVEVFGRPRPRRAAPACGCVCGLRTALTRIPHGAWNMATKRRSCLLAYRCFFFTFLGCLWAAAGHKQLHLPPFFVLFR